MPHQWRNQFWQSLEEGAGKRSSECDQTIDICLLLCIMTVVTGLCLLSTAQKRELTFDSCLEPV